MRKSLESQTHVRPRSLFRRGWRSLSLLWIVTALGLGLAVTPAGLAGRSAPTSHQHAHLADLSTIQQTPALIIQKESRTVARADHSSERTTALKVVTARDNAQSNEFGHGKRQSKFGCLPQGAQLNDVVTYGGSKNGNVTVEKTLTRMKAQCRNGKLVDAKRREIRFFRPSCWGNAPSDYQEIQQRETAELEKLKRRYTVILFTCNPMIQ